MSGRINDETIDNISILAKLEISDEQREVVKKDMEDMLVFIEKMNELDTDKVKPLSHSYVCGNVFREDEVIGIDDSENMLRNAPVKEKGYLKVPKTIG